MEEKVVVMSVTDLFLLSPTRALDVNKYRNRRWRCVHVRAGFVQTRRSQDRWQTNRVLLFETRECERAGFCKGGSWPDRGLRKQFAKYKKGPECGVQYAALWIDGGAVAGDGDWTAGGSSSVSTALQ
jgi:hypothetical protein